MSQQQFLPFLTDDQGKSLTVEDQVVVTRALPSPLEHSPEGWENSVVQFTRNNEFRGLIKSYTTALKFFLDGAKILRNAFYSKGVEAILYFIWLKQNTTFGAGLKHESWYKGEPDLSTFKDGYDSVEVNIAEGGFHKKLQANKAVPYEMSTDHENAISLYMDGLVLTQNSNYGVLAIEDASAGIIGMENLKTYGAIITTKEGLSGSVVTKNQDYEQIASGGDLAYMSASNNCLAQNYGDVAVTFSLTGSIKFHCHAGSGGTHLQMYFRTATDIYMIFTGLVLTPGADYIYEFDDTITLAAGEKLFLFGAYTRPGFGGGVIEFQENSTFRISFDSRFKATTVKAVRAFDLGNYLVDKMSDGKSSLSGSVLSDDYNLLCTSGDAIRGIAGAVLKTRFSDWHKSVDAVKCIALQVTNNNPVVHSRYDRFNDTTIAALGECNWKPLEVATDYIYDTINVGYPNQQNSSYDNLNGRYEFNTTHVYKAPVTRVKNTYDAVSVYRADAIGIEATRINLEGKTTTDNKSDSDMFFIDAEKMYADVVGLIQFTGPHTISIAVTGLDLQPGTRFKITTGLNNRSFTVESATEGGGLTAIVVTEQVINEAVDTTLVWMHYKLRRLPYTSVTGIPHPDSMFNIELSPKRILANHYRWIRSGLHQLDGKTIKFQTTDKNPSLATVRNGVTITEASDVAIATMGDRVYLPYYFNIEVESPENLLGLMNANSSGHFDFLFEGRAFEGFPIDIKTNESNLEQQTYKLLATANCDMALLINNR
jgi:hypothetical protein